MPSRLVKILSVWVGRHGNASSTLISSVSLPAAFIFLSYSAAATWLGSFCWNSFRSLFSKKSLLCLAAGALSFAFSSWRAWCFCFFSPIYLRALPSSKKFLPHKMSEKREVKESHFLSHSMFLDRLRFISQTLQTNMTYMASTSPDYIRCPTVQRSNCIFQTQAEE